MKHHDHVLSYYIFSNFTPTYLNMQIYTYVTVTISHNQKEH